MPLDFILGIANTFFAGMVFGFLVATGNPLNIIALAINVGTALWCWHDYIVLLPK